MKSLFTVLSVLLINGVWAGPQWNLHISNQSAQDITVKTPARGFCWYGSENSVLIPAGQLATITTYENNQGPCYVNNSSTMGDGYMSRDYLFTINGVDAKLTATYYIGAIVPDPSDPNPPHGISKINFAPSMEKSSHCEKDSNNSTVGLNAIYTESGALKIISEDWACSAKPNAQ